MDLLRTRWPVTVRPRSVTTMQNDLARTYAEELNREPAFDAPGLTADGARILGIVLLSWVIVWVAQMVVGLTLQVLLAVVVRNPVLVAVVGNLIGMVLYPFLSIALMVLYYDQRIRNEGYDLDLMTDGLTPASPI